MFKRAGDVIGSLIAIAVFSPLWVVIPICIKVESRGPVLFKQNRFGENEAIFRIVKFRTMRVEAPQLPPTKFQDPDKYITRVGRVLRKTSLDELPQLFNVLIGQMSFIGPRPGAVLNESDLFEERRKRGVFSVKPGITGWAQVNGRDALAHNIEEKAKFDQYYVENLSLRLDFICLIKTFRTVLIGEGYQEGSASQLR